MRFVFVMFFISFASANCNFNFSEKQQDLLEKAFLVGQPEDLGYTLASITWKESFVGQYIIRNNNSDGNHGSFGVTHVQLTTAMTMLGIRSSWKARDELLPRMITDDDFVLSLSLNYLRKFDDLPYRKKVARYNGFGEMADKYAEDIVNRVHRLIGCEYFKDLNLI